jgi:hypothetical protein
MESGQIRGVCPDLARELTGRRYTTGATAGSLDATVAIEPKRQMKARSGVSPDIADAFLMLFDLCRSRLGFRAQAGRATAQRKSESWNNFRKKKLKLSGGNRPKFNMKSLIYDRGAPKIFVGRAKNLNFVR